MDTGKTLFYVDAPSAARALSAAVEIGLGEESNMLALDIERRPGSDTRYRVTVTRRLSHRTKRRRYSVVEKLRVEHRLLRQERREVNRRLQRITERMSTIDALIARETDQ